MRKLHNNRVRSAIFEALAKKGCVGDEFEGMTNSLTVKEVYETVSELGYTYTYNTIQTYLSLYNFFFAVGKKDNKKSYAIWVDIG